MPIYEYVCKECENRFELLVRGLIKIECPSCSSSKLEKQLSAFAAGKGKRGEVTQELPILACGTCGDPRGPGSCSIN